MSANQRKNVLKNVEIEKKKKMKNYKYKFYTFLQIMEKFEKCLHFQYNINIFSIYSV